MEDNPFIPQIKEFFMNKITDIVNVYDYFWTQLSYVTVCALISMITFCKYSGYNERFTRALHNVKKSVWLSPEKSC